MAISIIDVNSAAGYKKYVNTDIAEVIAGIDSGAGKIHSIVIDNVLNATAVHLKLWNIASGSVTVGTTAPNWVFVGNGSTKTTIVFVEGTVYDTALSIACVTTAGTAGVTGPTSNVGVEIIYET
jgi:hypothetical protein